MELRANFIVGKNTDTLWSGVYGYKPDNNDDLRKLGEMFAVFRFETEFEDFAIDKFAKILVESLQNAYFEELKDYKSTLQRLEEACWKMKSKMELLLSREEEISNVGIDMEMAISVFKGNFLYVVTIGESKVFISRDENFVDITEGLTDARGQGFLRSASLETQEEDRFCLATDKASKNLLNIEDALLNLDKTKLIEKGTQEGTALMIIADEDLEWVEEEKFEENDEIEEVVGLENQMAESEEDEILEKREAGDETFEDEDHSSDEVYEDDNDYRESNGIENNSEVDTQNFDIQEDEVDSDYTDVNDSEADSQVQEDDALYYESESEVELDEEEKVSVKERLLLMKERSVGALNGLKSKFFVGEEEFDADGHEDYEDQDDIEIKENTSRYSEMNNEEDGKGEVSNLAKIVIIPLGIISSIKNHFKNNKKTYAHIINSIYSKIKGVFQMFKSIFDKEILGKNLDRRALNKRRVKRNRYLLIISIVVIIVGIFYVNNSNQNREAIENAIESVETQLQKYTDEFNSVQTEVLNAQYAPEGDKNDLVNRILLLENNVDSALDEIDSNELIENKTEYIAKYQSISSELSVLSDDLLLIESFSDPQIVVDFSAQFSDAKISDLEYSEGSLFASDEGRDVIYKFGLSLSEDPLVHITDVTEPYILVRSIDGNIIVYDKDDNAVIGEFNPNDKESLQRFDNLIPPSVGGPTESAMFSNGALYEIHQTNKQIFKREASGDGFVNGGATYQATNPPNWKTDPELGEAIDIEVPYEVYVLTKNLGIRRYLGGGSNTLDRNIFLNLLDSDYNSLQNATALDVTTKYMAVGDSQNQRVLLFEIMDNEQKNVRFIRQYVYNGEDDSTFSNITELIVADAQIFVLDGNKIVRLDI